MARKEREGPRLEVLKHQAAEQRLKASILENRDYPGRDEDLALIRRKRRELGDERLKRILEGEDGRK